MDTNNWSNGLFGCFKDSTTCVMTWVFPCYVHGKVAQAVGDDLEACLKACFCWPIARSYIRGKVRKAKGIPGSGIGDCCISMWCGPCSLAQEAQEVGFNSVPDTAPINRQ